MTEPRDISNKTLQHALLSHSDYTWEYEYYEYGPVSFEDLKAHKYSIVIGFWVGLAVFVIFMFFVLTLLTKTGVPHQERINSSEKKLCTNNFVADFGQPLDSERIFSQQLFLHYYINELEDTDRTKQCHKVPVMDTNIHFQEVIENSGRLEEGLNCHTKFNIPNFVNYDSLGEDDLLISEPSIILENKPVSQVSCQILA
ncbi:melanocortin-2 receptor accessory protein 2 [Ahaetulla prasina]|uniref:melanocortin-2 receptor accessory protein 2 n=1 Tax=Ahaetulla prasina TaxID=499056 RepID=UPI002647C6F3|nr:melanocortin-2 receptor accessory protein 2 [Ahaetulla prasina]XP_058020079.1 melanocortin-2 receptor accessory protein 2 [Ahaetulla prasina]